MRRLPLVLLLLAACTPKKPVANLAPDPAVPESPLPVDPGVRSGHLDNGIAWYVETNARPEQRAVLRLVVDAGSVLEDEDQLGLAHFVEHMAFNGTEHFPGNEPVKYLESVGTSFGAHLNAHTSFDETVYKLVVPTDDTELLDKGLLVLSDWAGGVAFTDEEIEKERGVVLEEWRSRLGAGARIRDAMYPLTYYGSPYPDRKPIGTEESLKTFGAEALRRFYRDWYRPDLMAVIAVGDFDPDWMQAKIVEHFGGLQSQSKRVRTRPGLPDHDTLVGIVSDAEVTRTGVTVMAKHDDVEGSTHADYRESLVQQVVVGVLSERFADLARQPEPPFLGARPGATRLTPTEGADYLGVAPVADDPLPALEAALVEVRRLRVHGVTAPELERAKANVLRGYESYKLTKDTTDSTRHAEEIIRVFTTGEPMPGIDYEYALATRYVPEITVDEANAWAAQFMGPQSRVVQITMPVKDGLTAPTEANVVAALARADAAEVTAPTADNVDVALMAELPAPGTVTTRGAIPELGLTQWTLSNGVKVNLKPTTFDADQVLLTAHSHGGSSLVDDARWVAARTAVAVAARSGLGPHDASTLGKLLAGKTVSAGPWISGDAEGIGASSSKADVETMFQLVHLWFTQPRFDADAFTLDKTARATALENRLADPNAVFSDKVTELVWQGHPRTKPWTVDTLEQMDLAGSRSVFEERFADGDDFEFTIVGNFDLAEIEPLVARYLGSLPVREGSETSRDEGARYPEGVTQETVHEGMEHKARVRILFHGPVVSTWENRSRFYGMMDVLSTLLREKMREDMGGVYGVGAWGGTAELPIPTYTVTLDWSCDPDRVEELKKAAYEVIAELKRGEVKASYIDEMKAKKLRSRETDEKDNGFWIGAISGTFARGEDPRDLLGFNDRVTALTAKTVHEAAKLYLNEASRVEVVMLPKTASPNPPTTPAP